MRLPYSPQSQQTLTRFLAVAPTLDQDRHREERDEKQTERRRPYLDVVSCGPKPKDSVHLLRFLVAPNSPELL